MALCRILLAAALQGGWMLFADGLTTGSARANTLAHMCLASTPSSHDCRLMPHNNTSPWETASHSNSTTHNNDVSPWLVAQFIPECWHVLRHFLCSVYAPECRNGTRPKAPCRSLCLRSKYACAFVPSIVTNGTWPADFDCDTYPNRDCLDHTAEFDSNDIAKCPAPLTETAHEGDWYLGIRGCALQCSDPLWADSEHSFARRFVAVAGVISFLLSLFAVATYLIDWRLLGRYPAVVIFYLNVCFLMASFGWLLQFAAGDAVICRPDGTLRRGEPSTDSGYGWCLVTFVVVYYFSIAGCLWFVVLAYAWHLSFKNLGRTTDRLSNRTPLFHVSAWLVPVVMTMVVLVMGEVDGSSASGICFVGYRNLNFRHVFVLAPLSGSLAVGGFFLARGLLTLCRLRRKNRGLLNGKAAAKIGETIARIGLFSFFAFAFVVITIASQMVASAKQADWQDSMKELFKCVAYRHVTNVSTGDWRGDCRVTSKPSLVAMQFQFFAAFGSAVIMSSWVWTKNTARAWRKMCTRMREYDIRKRLWMRYNFQFRKRRIHPAMHQIVPTVTALVLPVSEPKWTQHPAAPRRHSMPWTMGQGAHTPGEAAVLFAHRRRTSDTLSPRLLRSDKRGTVMSLESYRTTSSLDRLFVNRDIRRASCPGAAQTGCAFGHLRSVTAQLHRPLTDLQLTSRHSLGNMRIIRLNDEMRLPDIGTTAAMTADKFLPGRE